MKRGTQHHPGLQGGAEACRSASVTGDSFGRRDRSRSLDASSTFTFDAAEARLAKRFPSSQCASTFQMVRPARIAPLVSQKRVTIGFCLIR
jgi:hypothetical protein